MTKIKPINQSEVDDLKVKNAFQDFDYNLSDQLYDKAQENVYPDLDEIYKKGIENPKLNSLFEEIKK